MTSLSSSSEIRYRQLVFDDWEGFKRVGSASLPIVYPDEYWVMLSSDTEMHYSLGAFYDNELVGAVALVKDSKNTYAAPKGTEQQLVNEYNKVAYVSCMVVAESARRRGVATALLSTAMDTLQREEGVDAFYLHVMVSNEKAIKLYEKLGFFNEKTIDGYYTINGEKSDAFFYVRRLHRAAPPQQKCNCHDGCSIT